MLLNFRQLEVFRAVMIAKTISGAAELLNVSQPGISRLLKYMEYKLGIPLFERHKGRLIPTPEGLEIFRELEPIYQRVEGLDDTINRIVGAESQQLHIACSPSLSNAIVPWLFAQIRKEMPKTVIKLETLANEDIAEYVSQRRIDFALALNRLSHPLITCESSIKLGLQVVVPASHRLANQDVVTFEDLRDELIVDYFPETLLGCAMRDGFQAMDATPNVSMIVRYSDDACAMVEQGLGVTLAFQFTALKSRYSELVAIDMAMPGQQLYFVRHNEVSMSNHLRQCYEMAQQKLLSLHTNPLT